MLNTYIEPRRKIEVTANLFAMDSFSCHIFNSACQFHVLVVS